jgi:hypothetical protein
VKKPFLITTVSFKIQSRLSRVPKKYKKLVRHSKKTTFVYPNKRAIRVVKSDRHFKFLRKFDYLYSSSANITKKRFDIEFATKRADIVVEDSRGLLESSSSQLLKLGRNTLKKIR